MNPDARELRGWLELHVTSTADGPALPDRARRELEQRLDLLPPASAAEAARLIAGLALAAQRSGGEYLSHQLADCASRVLTRLRQTRCAPPPRAAWSGLKRFDASRSALALRATPAADLSARLRAAI